MKLQFALFSFALALPILAQGPDAKTNPVAATAAGFYTQVAGNVTKSIDKIPADKFAFKPTDGVRNTAELIGHIIDANWTFCSPVTGATKPASVAKETSKEVLAAAWKGAQEECNKAWAKTTDASLGQNIKFGKGERLASWTLFLNTSHTWEHYGNLVTYMRMNGLVPPSSEGR